MQIKTGIITFHRAKNYGAVLQCYSLVNYIKSIGYDVEVIDYFPSYFKEEYSDINWSSFRTASLKLKIVLIFDFLLKYTKQRRRSRSFLRFINRLPLGRTFDERSISFDDYNIVFVGSDQVWNQKLTHGVDLAFTGAIPHTKCLLASYAASTEMYDNIHELDDYYRRVLCNFDFVSVRENKLNEYFNSLIPGKSRHVLDPVLLLSKEQWTKISKKPIESGYLLIYTVPQDPKVFEIARIIAQERKLRIIELVSKVRYIYKKDCKQKASPEEFLGYFVNADFIVTTSFHGTAFSLRFEKQFYTVMLGRSVDERALDLLNNVGLGARAVFNSESVKSDPDINYNQVRASIEQYVSNSKSYISDVVESSNKCIK